MKLAIILVDHGSRRPEANAQLDEVAEAVRPRFPDHLVAIAHLELAEPTIAQAIEHCAANDVDEIVVHPYFLGPGRHTTLDIPQQVADATSAHDGIRVSITEPLGLHAALIDVIAERVEAASDAVD